MTSFQLISGPAVEPLLMAEVKLHLRLDHNGEDALLDSLIRASRVAAETYTGRAFITQSWRLLLDVWPTTGVLCLPVPPLQSVETVATLDQDNAETLISSSQFWVDTGTMPGQIILKATGLSPVPGKRTGGIKIEFTAGYGDNWNAVPEGLRLGMLQHVTHLYENRGLSGVPVPMQVIDLWRPYRMMRI